MTNILVAGSNWQLDLCIKDIYQKYSKFKFYFKNSSELNFIEENIIKTLFSEINYCIRINCSTYIAVHKEEKE